MADIKEITAVLDKMILSASGWRGVFAAGGGEEDKHEQISSAHRLISAAAALIFAEYLQNSHVSDVDSCLILLGTDTRPTGKAIVDAMIPVLLAAGCDVSYAGITAAPEIMAWARNNEKASGFIYISASHNPIGHNGIKFGLTDGGVLSAEESTKLITNFQSFFKSGNCIEKIEALISAADSGKTKDVFSRLSDAKNEARNTYYNFCSDVALGGNASIAATLKNSLVKQPLGVVCDFNGSARTVSIDREYFSALGLKFISINSEPGQIVHRIVPEGESLEPCRQLLEEAHAKDASFMLGFVPDCDGDRGNLVIWDETLGKARALEAQEVFALACAAELSHLVWTGELAYDDTGKALIKAAVVVNDPTSMRIDRIAEAFDVSVFRAEVGEANVVGLARALRQDGYLVRILGEGSAGGNITHPSAVRDPINTVLALVKFLALSSNAEKKGLFEIWCARSGQLEKYRPDYTLADIIASLPDFSSTPAYSKDAVLCVKTEDHALLKDRYKEVFLREWEERKDELRARYGIYNWEAVAYNGQTEKRRLSRFGEAGRGGFKICFFDEKGKEIAYIWMRGSATEPVFRIMADVDAAFSGALESISSHTPAEGRLVDAAEGGIVKADEMERDLLKWQRRMIEEADVC
ncbi:MAG: phosphatidylglycerol lysyltransferase [Treponema sp.]|jgi:phosphoglucomutase|nr:phosphatidylglycerol lysyltransferase [Treponema sp.]